MADAAARNAGPNRLRELEEENEELRRKLEDDEQTIQAIKSGGVDAFVVQIKNGERIFSLRGADAAYRAFVEQMRDGALTVASDGTILYCNSRFSSLLAELPARIVGSNLIDHVSAEDGFMAEALLRRGERRETRGEVSLVTSAGDRIATYLSIFPIELEGVLGACVLVQDNTEINRYKSELDRLVEMRTLELRESNARLNELGVVKTQMLARVADDLRHPLAEIESVLEHLRATIDESGAEAGSVPATDTAAMTSAVAKLKVLLEDIRALCDVESGQTRVEYGRVHVRSVLLETAASLESLAEAKGVEISLDVPSDDIAFIGDGSKILSVLKGLLRLGIESADRGAIRVNGTITPELVARFEVSVPAASIPADNVRLILGGTLDPVGAEALPAGVSALSLWTSERIAQLVNGDLALVTDEDGGVSFVFTVPV